MSETIQIAQTGKDITESVQVLYDITVQSLDWGSGFLDEDEMSSVIELAIDMGWQLPDLQGQSIPCVCVAAKYSDHYLINDNTPGRYPRIARRSDAATQA